MTSPIPGLLAWPVLILITLTFVGRCWLLCERPVDRLINRALIAALVGLLLREEWFERLLAWLLPGSDKDVIHLARQLSLGAILVIVMHIYAMARLWAGADPEDTWRRQRKYDLITVVITVIMLIAGAPARRSDQLVDQALGWPAVVLWVAFCAPVGVTALYICRLGVRDLRAARATSWPELAFYAWMFTLAAALGVEAIFTSVETVAAVLTHGQVIDPTMGRKAWSFFLSAVGAPTAVAVPMISALLTRLGWDRPGRYIRRLEPMWADLTAAMPEVVLDLPYRQDNGMDPAIRLHRMTIEIRDSLLHLKRYSDNPEQLDAANVEPRLYVRHVAEAIAAKKAGRPPKAGPSKTRHHVTPGARDLNAELRQLLSLAKAWRHNRKPTTTLPLDPHPTPAG